MTEQAEKVQAGEQQSSSIGRPDKGSTEIPVASPALSLDEQARDLLREAYGLLLNSKDATELRNAITAYLSETVPALSERGEGAAKEMLRAVIHEAQHMHSWNDANLEGWLRAVLLYAAPPLSSSEKERAT